MRVAWHCEPTSSAARVLARHWPGVPCYPDVRELRAADVEPVDVLCGGFPCQDISLAGKGAGIDGARSGLWAEYARLIGELRPRYVIVENVPALLGRGLGRVLGDLAALGYDAEWDCLPASAFGAPHRRDRVWLVAYPQGGSRADGARLVDSEALVGPVAGTGGRDSGRNAAEGIRVMGGGLAGSAEPAREVADTEGIPVRPGLRPDGPRGERRRRLGDGGGARLSDPASNGRRPRRQGRPDSSGQGQPEQPLQDSDECALQPWRVGGRATQAGGPEWWAVEPPVGRVAHGVPDRLDQLAALGDALTPYAAEWIGHRIVSYEQSRELAA
jgi:DNA (cytosine-5)-methyltransferase 1